MTIAAGFVCSDGIVMCSDSQETSADLKWSVEKLVTDNSFGLFPLMISGAGFGAAVDNATQRIVDKLQGGFTDHKVVVEHIRNILRDIYENDLANYPTSYESDKQFDLLIGFKVEGEEYPSLYKTEGSLVNRVRTYAILGSGTIVNNEANLLFEKFPRMPTSRGVILALHLIRLAKSQVTSIGGRSVIAVLSNSGQFGQTNPWEIPTVEGLIAKISFLSGRLALRCADPSYSEGKFVKDLEMFSSHVSGLRNEIDAQRKDWQAAMDILSGVKPSGDQKSESER